MENKLNIAPMKVCKSCGRELPIDKFYRKSKGYRKICMDCCEENLTQKSMKLDMIDELLSYVSYDKLLEFARTRNADVSLARYEPRELLAELKKRGYKWTDMSCELKIDWNKI